MFLIEKLLGANRSSEFLANLPKITIRRLIWNLIKVLIFVFILPLSITTIILLIGKDSFAKNEITQSTVFMFLMYPSMIFFSYRYFYSSFVSVKEQLVSLKSSEVLKHLIIISIFISLLTYFFSVIGFILNPAGIGQTLSSFKEVSSQSINYVELMMLPVLWLLVGLGEELLFRAGIYRSLRNSFSRNISLIITSILFVIIHPISITNSLTLFIISMLYGFYFEYKNNLLTITILHMFQDLWIAGICSFSAAYTANIIVSFYVHLS